MTEQAELKVHMHRCFNCWDRYCCRCSSSDVWEICCPDCVKRVRAGQTKGKIQNLQEALEEIVCMQHMHEGEGGCHGPCPICCASAALGMHKYLENPGDKERVEELKKKFGYA